MIDIQPLTVLDPDVLRRVASGYTSESKYAVAHIDSLNRVSFELHLVDLAKPYTKQFHFDDETLQHYRSVIAQGYSFGAFDGSSLVGLIIAEPRAWNKSVCIWEYHVAAEHRRHGIGRKLMAVVAERARERGFRVLVCETQTTNVPAIAAYRKLGFRLEGLDLSFYTNRDYPGGEIAVFMKKTLE
jgi:streptothricin acetyltransferase